MIENKKTLPELPRGWTWTTIEDILLTLESGGRPKGGVKNIKEGIPSIGGEHLLYSGRFNFFKKRYIPREFYEKMIQGKILKKDVLVVKDGATTGKTAFVSDSFPFNEAAVNEHVFILRVLEEYTSPKYLFFWMQSPYGQKCVKDNFQGTAQGGINLLFAKNSNFPFPPLPEQHRIVAKIEELFTKLDAGVEALKKIKTQLKRYRQAVLKYAFEGKLTKEWRETHKGKLEPASVLLEQIKEERNKNVKGKCKELPTLYTSDLPEVPEGWVWTYFYSLLREPLRNGHSAKSSPDKKGIRTLTLSAVTERDFTKKNTKITIAKPIRVKDLWLKYGDILIERSNTIEYVGLSAIYLGPDNFAIFPDLLIRARVNSSYIYPQFAECYLRTPFARRYFKSKAQGISGSMPKIDQKTIERLPIPLPPVKEQNKIIQEIESRFSVADGIEKTVEQSLKQGERLRHSILKEAFEGRLVPQDPSDEPASVLLELIKAEKTKREAEEKMKKRLKSKVNMKQMRLF